MAGFWPRPFEDFWFLNFDLETPVLRGIALETSHSEECSTVDYHRDQDACYGGNVHHGVLWMSARAHLQFKLRSSQMAMGHAFFRLPNLT